MAIRLRGDLFETVIDGPKYVVVIDRLLGIIYRVKKRRVGLMRFGGNERRA